MVSVKCEYANYQSKNKRDYFVYTDVEVSGHAEYSDMHHTTGIKLCAGISACCYGIRRLIDEGQFNVEIRKGYFHIWTERRFSLKQALDRESVYALNTLVCQLYELYVLYPNYFKKFDLVDVKEKIEDEQKTNERNNEWCGREPKHRKKNLQHMGIHSLIEKTHS